MPIKVFGIKSVYSSSVVEIPYNDKVEVRVGDSVIFKDVEEKEEFGIVKYIDKNAVEEDKVIFTSKILRPATPNDFQKVESHRENEVRAMDVCKNLIKSMGLDMYVFRVGYSFDGSKVHFTFTADERVDFRDLVKELAKKLKKQIHLRQIGPRDKAKLIGGYGRCGRPLCCSSFLGRLESINMDMVRHQGLESKGSSKLSGACGKLLCCLKYEVEAYKDLRKNMPEFGSIVRLGKSVPSPVKEAHVIGLDILNQKLKVQVENGDIFIVGLSDIDKVLKAAPKPEFKS